MIFNVLIVNLLYNKLYKIRFYIAMETEEVKFRHFLFYLLFLIYLGGCSGSQFKGGDEIQRSSSSIDPSNPYDPDHNDPAISIIAKPSSRSNDDDDDDDGGIDLSFKSYSDVELSSGEGSKQPVTVMFLLDITKSMNKSIDTVKSNVQGFVSRLIQQGYNNVKLGFIAFKDTVIKTYNPTNNYSDFSAQVGNLSIGQGEDSPEGGLLAIQTAVNYFTSSANWNTYLKIIVLISDDLAHSHATDGSLNAQCDDGTLQGTLNCWTSRSCDIQSTVNLLNSISSSQQTRFKLFYSVPSGRTCCTCSSYTDAKVQINQLLSHSLTSVKSINSRGGYLGWTDSFDTNILLNTLPTAISSTTDGSQLVCLVKKIDFNIGGKTVTYNSTFSKEYALYKNGSSSTLTIDDPQIVKSIKSGKITEGTATVKQSCFDIKNAQSGNFSSPSSTESDTVKYSLSYKG